MKMSKRVRNLAAIVGSGIVVASSAACGVDGIAPPTQSSADESPRQVSFVPAAPSYALGATRIVGVEDGTYTFTINPTINQVVNLGPNRLELPASSVCALGTSGYGPTMWDFGCHPQKRSFTLTVIVQNASTSYSSIDFQPAMRFNPTKRVALYFYVPAVTTSDADNWNILYCPTAAGKRGVQTADPTCVNEALTDPSLAPQIDTGASMLSRRIKHFSGYRVDGGWLVTE